MLRKCIQRRHNSYWHGTVKWLSFILGLKYRNLRVNSLADEYNKPQRSTVFCHLLSYVMMTKQQRCFINQTWISLTCCSLSCIFTAVVFNKDVVIYEPVFLFISIFSSKSHWIGTNTGNQHPTCALRWGQRTLAVNAFDERTQAESSSVTCLIVHYPLLNALFSTGQPLTVEYCRMCHGV